jgi:hypothetical protein
MKRERITFIIIYRVVLFYLSSLKYILEDGKNLILILMRLLKI